MHTDLPLNDNSKDKLGRHQFANEIANGLVNSFKENNESIVLGINGNWGSGKSTLLNFIINDIEKLSKKNNQEILVLRFNPWMFSGQKELQTVFLRELILKLKNNSEKLKNASKKIAEFLEYLNWVNYVHSGIGELINFLKSVFKKAGNRKDITELKNDIDKILIDSKVKLYITIDDIDRLTPSEITEIFQLIKLNGNFANTIFLLAYDQQVVESALENQFGKNGKKYIEKIVQIDYTLPSISKDDIARLFIDSINHLFNNDQLTSSIYNLSETIKKEPFIIFLKSLRDIYRFNNSIKLRLPSIFNEINILDFLLIESLRIFNQNAYHFIIFNKNKLIYKGNNDINNFNSHSQNSKSTEEFIEKSEFDENTKSILKRLFVLDSASFIIDSSQELIREKRIANSSYFDRYFNLQLTNFDIPELVFEKFINDNSIVSKRQILQEVNADNQLFHFLNWVEIKCRGIEENKLQKIIYSILIYSENLEFKNLFLWGIGSELHIVFFNVSKMLGNVKDYNSRRAIILESLRTSKSFSSFYLCVKIILANNKRKEGKLHSKVDWYYLFSFENLIDEEFIKLIIKERNTLAKELYTQLLKNREFLKEDEIVQVLEVVFENDNKFYQETFPNLIQDDKELVKYIWISIKRCWMTRNGQVGYQLAKYQFIPGLNIDEVVMRFKQFEIKDFDDNEKKVINLFMESEKDGFMEKKYYDIDTLKVIEGID